MKGAIYVIDYKTAVDFLLPRHYSGRVPMISIAFGWYDCQYERDEEGITHLPDVSHLKAVCTFGKPASPPLCIGVCGVENKEHVYELNRLCRVEEWEEPLSQFVASCLRTLEVKNWIVVSFSDTDMGHNGYIYQACNFIYTGVTRERTDKYTEGNKHCRHYDNSVQGEYRKIRSAKHRYIFFCTRDRRLRRRWRSQLKYRVMEYPKGENKKYVLGEYQTPRLVKVEK